MKILITHSSGFDFKGELYTPIRESELNKKHEFILPEEGKGTFYTRPGMEKGEIQLQIAEVSYPSTGQGIELGWANVYKVPVVCIYRKGQRYSGALKLVSETFIEYTDVHDMLKKIEIIISAINDEGYKG